MVIDELEVKRLCNKYKMKYKIFEATNTIMIETPLDTWLLKVTNRKERPIYILHQNRFHNRNRFHFQRSVNTIFQAIDVILNHKGVLKQIYKLPNTYQKRKMARRG